jgi:hypothetical protein
VSETEARATIVSGPGWDEAGGPSVRTALSCHPRTAGRSPSTGAAGRTTGVSEKDPRTSPRPSGPTAEGPAKAARRAGPREEKTCPFAREDAVKNKDWRGEKTVCEEGSYTFMDRDIYQTSKMQSDGKPTLAKTLVFCQAQQYIVILWA